MSNDYRDFVITTNDGREFLTRLTARYGNIKLGESFMKKMITMISEGAEFEGHWDHDPDGKITLVSFPGGVASVEAI